MNSSSIHEETRDRLWHLTKDIIIYAGLPFTIIGIIGNILNLIIFTREKFRKLSIGFYLSCLSASDIFQTYLVLCFYFQKYDIILENTSKFMCKLHNYLYATLPLISAWIIVIVAVDRLISVKFIHATKWTNKRACQVFIVLTILVIIALLNLHCFIIYDLKPNELNENVCVVSNENFVLSQRFIFYNCLVSITLVPFTIMTICTCSTITTLISSRKRINNGKSLERETRFAILLVVLNIVFLIFYVPVCLAMVINDREYSTNMNLNKQLFDLAYVIFYLAVYFRHAHSSFQFFIYLAINKTFRSEFLRLVLQTTGMLKSPIESSALSSKHKDVKSSNRDVVFTSIQA
jgi:hypothetical protein